MERWSLASAALGAVVWVVAPWLPVGAPPSFGSIEHVFVSLPLVGMPLALVLLSRLVGPYVAAQRTQPAAASMVLASFFASKGALAGALAAPWVVLAVLIAVRGAPRAARGPGMNLSSWSLLAAHLFLPIGAVWLVLSRLGIGPRAFSAATVFLAAVHFHFSGFTLQILISSVGRRLTPTPARVGTAHRCVAVGATFGLMAIAAGNALASPSVKGLGVALVVVSTLALAITTIAVARDDSAPQARRILLVAVGSVVGAMTLAAIYGLGELTGHGWIGIERMVRWHGVLNAVGVIAWLGFFVTTEAELASDRRLARPAPSAP